jgi:hypothetical protein
VAVPQERAGEGRIGIFNRSHYEDVLVVRVKGLVSEEVWRERYDEINAFERNLSLDGITVLKFFLHISKDEQKRRLQSRLDNPDKRWKFSSADIKERAFWDDYQAAFEDALTNCSTGHAPWYVVPANKKWYRNLVVARTIADTLAAIGPQYPPAEEGLELVEIPDWKGFSTADGATPGPNKRLRRPRASRDPLGERGRLLRCLKEGRYVPCFPRRRFSHAPSANQPPSTERVWPLTKPLHSGSARKATVLAMSSGVAKRAIGTRPSMFASV